MCKNVSIRRKRDDELGIRQQELKLEHRHAQLKEQLNTRLSCSSEYGFELKSFLILRVIFYGFVYGLLACTHSPFNNFNLTN